MKMEKILVRNSDNSIDHDATCAAFTASLVEFEANEIARNAELKETFGAIHSAVNAVFDKYPGVCINTPALVGFAIKNLPDGMVTPKTHSEISTRCTEYIQESSKEGGILRMKTGPGGGITRICDEKPVVAAK